MERRYILVVLVALLGECAFFGYLGWWWVVGASALLVTVILATMIVRARRPRVKRHFCAKCGYEIGTLRRCPECGWNAHAYLTRVARQVRASAMARGQR